MSDDFGYDASDIAARRPDKLHSGFDPDCSSCQRRRARQLAARRQVMRLWMFAIGVYFGIMAAFFLF